MKVTVTYNEDTDLLDIKSSGGTISMSQTEVAGLYMVLHDILGWKGRFTIWRKKRLFKRV